MQISICTPCCSIMRVFRGGYYAESKKKNTNKGGGFFEKNVKVSRYGIGRDLFKDCERLGYKLLRYHLEKN